ncbi:hypothetical protein GIB67_009141 [Kingdonia uniflora]|uniref:ATP-dependent DNA helicase n=1 Tax=Kingdonia uniflora TaxID=39325 RepID=A0A7J7N2H5_9MAGN|nr:hypothetical protein GIB67_009141 [Kingdonia uniflora]
MMHFQDLNAETVRCKTVPNVFANLEEVQEKQSRQPETPLTPSRQAVTPEVHFYAGDWEELHTVLSVVKKDDFEPVAGMNRSFSEEDFMDGCSSQEGSIIGNESSSRRSGKLSGSRAWERANETGTCEGGYDVILMTEIPYSTTSLKKIYALVKKVSCLLSFFIPYRFLSIFLRRRESRNRNERNSEGCTPKQAQETARRRRARAQQSMKERTSIRTLDSARRRIARSHQDPGPSTSYPIVEEADNEEILHVVHNDYVHPFLGIFNATSANFMDPGSVPIELSRLTNLEQILIAPIHPMMSLYRFKGQQYKYSENVTNFEQDVNAIATSLPFKPSDVSTILIVNRSGAHATKEFRVRREFVRQALAWLKEHNIYYRDITINMGSLQELPEDGIPKNLPHPSEIQSHGPVGDVYVKKNPEDRNITMQGVRDMVSSGNQQLARRISYYANSIHGFRAYWFTKLKEYTAMVNQLGVPTICFTLSTANMHWPELYKLLDPANEIETMDYNEQRKRTGKSTVINTIVRSTVEHFGTSKAVRIMAPTGVAAFNIGGATVHHESITVERRTTYKPKTQDDFKDTKLIILDEYSMLGRSMIATVDLRCRDIIGLSRIFRQVGDEQAPFGDPLGRLNSGTCTFDDWKLFKTRDWSILRNEEKEEFRYALHLFPTRIAPNEHNRTRLIELGKPCLRPPYGVLYLTAKKNHHISFNSCAGARYLRSLADEEGIFGAHVITETSDREMWKFFLK